MNKEDQLIPNLRFPEFEKDGKWKKKKLGQVGEIITGNTPVTSELINYNGNKLFVSPADINDVRYIEDTKTKLSEIGFSKTRHIAPNSVLFVCIGSTIGKIAQNKVECATNQQINSIIPSNEYSSDFLYSILENSASQISELAGIQAVPIINKSQFSEVTLPIPENLGEQEKIASCLSSLDEVITAHGQKLKLLKEHKKGLMQNLFPKEGENLPKYRFPEFKNDGKWLEKKLGEIADVSKLAGYEFTKHIVYEDKGKIIALRGLNIKNNRLNLSDIKYIDNSELAKLSRSKLFVDDLLFTYIGTIGEVALIDENDRYYLAPNVSRIRPNKETILSSFLLQYFNIPFFKHKEVAKYISSSSQPALTMENVRKFSIFLPSIPEQQKIASCVSALDEIIVAQADKIAQLKLFKKGLMQGFFPKMDG